MGQQEDLKKTSPAMKGMFRDLAPSALNHRPLTTAPGPAIVPVTALDIQFRRHGQPVPVWIAAIVLTAIVMMNVTASTGLCITSGQRQTRGLARQITNISKLPGRLTLQRNETPGAHAVEAPQRSSVSSCRKIGATPTRWPQPTSREQVPESCHPPFLVCLASSPCLTDDQVSG